MFVQLSVASVAKQTKICKKFLATVRPFIWESDDFELRYFWKNLFTDTHTFLFPELPTHVHYSISKMDDPLAVPFFANLPEKRRHPVHHFLFPFAIHFAAIFIERWCRIDNTLQPLTPNPSLFTFLITTVYVPSVGFYTPLQIFIFTALIVKSIYLLRTHKRLILLAIIHPS